jgi:hypothetical protein
VGKGSSSPKNAAVRDAAGKIGIAYAPDAWLRATNMQREDLRAVLRAAQPAMPAPSMLSG